MITIKITRKDSTKLQNLMFLIASKTKPTDKEIKFAQDFHTKIHKLQLDQFINTDQTIEWYKKNYAEIIELCNKALEVQWQN